MEAHKHAHVPGSCHCCFIIPPHVIKKLSKEAKSEADRDRLFETLRLTENLRGQRFALRSLLSQPQQQTGELSRTVYDAHHSTRLPGKLVRSEGQAAVSDATVNAAYDNVGSTYTFYREQFDRNSVDGRGLRLDSTVHYARQFDNAFWNGQQMVYGDGHQFHDFAAALDVIGHELTHGVTQYQVPPDGLDYHDQPGALNESWSDVFGSMIKQWAQKPQQTVTKADWLIGATIVPAGWKALRSMKEPGTAFDGDPQPADMQHYAQMDDDEGGVHINSGIPNRAFYLACYNLSPNGFSWEKAGKVWYGAYRFLKHDSSFTDAANATSHAAQLLYGKNSAEQKAVEDAWKQVGVKASAEVMVG